MKFAGLVACLGEMKNACKILAGKPEGRRPLGRTRRRLEGNIRMNLRVIGWKVVNWIHLAQNRNQWQPLVNTVMYFEFHKKPTNF
jgi:hypothetical protein